MDFEDWSWFALLQLLESGQRFHEEKQREAQQRKQEKQRRSRKRCSLRFDHYQALQQHVQEESLLLDKANIRLSFEVCVGTNAGFGSHVDGWSSGDGCQG